MKNLLPFICFLLSGFLCQAQYNINQNKVWAFGDSLALEFTSGSPVAVISGIKTEEGSASICDGSGNLLFYTQGKRVWNRAGILMPSGSAVVPYETYSTAQAAIIVPVLDNPNRYYIFSLEQVDFSITSCRLSYSIVDMTLDGGYGDVIASSMGTPLTNNLSEKMIAVAGNNCNIWLLTQRKSVTEFLAYEITSTGINPTPVVSHVGTIAGRAVGVMKISPDRHLLAVTHFEYPSAPGGTELFDFNASTGMISNCRVINNHDGSYGAEFSSDSRKLYTSNYTPPSNIYQYDLTTPTAPAISASEYIVLSSVFPGSDLRLAPDNKIYTRGLDSNHLSCINDPNSLGGTCNLVNNVITLTKVGFWLAFPSIYWADPSAIISTTTGTPILCAGTSLALTGGLTSGTWSSNNTAVATVTPTGLVNGVASGTAVISYSTSCGVSTATVSVTATPVITGSTGICPGATTTLSGSLPGGSWISTNATIASVGVASGVVTGISLGTSIISYLLPTGCFASHTIAVVPCLGVNDDNFDATVTNFPNPSNGTFVVNIPGLNGEAELGVFDMPGRECVHIKTQISAGKITVSLPEIQAGNYIIKIESSGSIFRSRMTIVN